MEYVLSLSILITLFFAAGCAPSQYGFDEWDSNGNDLIDNEEFNQDLNDSDYYSNWDSNGGGILTEEEWGDGTESWANYDGDVGFSDWDFNNDNELTEDEFISGLIDTVDDDNDTIKRMFLEMASEQPANL